MVTEKEFLKVLNNKDKGPKPYDTTAEVVRVEDGVAWVHIDGGVEETPAELTINAVKGDRVKVRLVGGQAFLIGNGTAPPTDDRVANDALGVATGARVTAAQAEEVANVTEQRTRPAITSMITYYKLSNGTPDQPTEDDHEGWSEEEPLWDSSSDEQLYYSVRSRTVQGVINWTYPHVLSSYANMSILQNAILLEVGEGSTLAYIDDEYGNHLTDENNEPIYANTGSITDAYAQIRVMANEIMSEVSETYVNMGTSEIQSLSSVMRQTAEGVDIYATINGEESDTHTHIDNNSFDIVKDNKTIGQFGSNGLLIKSDIDTEGIIALLGYGETEGGETDLSPYYNIGKREENTLIGAYSIAEGAYTTASGPCAHAEGWRTYATGQESHAEGFYSRASGNNSHAEGDSTEATGRNSHAEGEGTDATGYCSHAEGELTIAAGSCQHVQGKYNVADSNGIYAFIIGGGTATYNRKNIFAVDWNGNIHLPAGKQVLYDL
jgi:hypothetical protein